MKTFAVAWVVDGWIYSQDPDQDAKYRIHEDWIWGPFGPDNRNTGYRVGDGWIWGPAGAENDYTGFYIADGWIWGPGPRLPFVPRV